MCLWACHRDSLGNINESILLGNVLYSNHAAQISRSSGSWWINISITEAALEERWDALEVVTLNVVSMEVLKYIFTLNT